MCGIINSHKKLYSNSYSFYVILEKIKRHDSSYVKIPTIFGASIHFQALLPLSQELVRNSQSPYKGRIYSSYLSLRIKPLAKIKPVKNWGKLKIHRRFLYQRNASRFRVERKLLSGPLDRSLNC